jgi:hypothetical protein
MRAAASALALLLLAGCAGDLPRDAAAVESLGMQAAQTGSATARRTLERWAGEAEAPLAGVAARELGLALAREPGRERDAAHWLAQAARAGDGEAAFTLAESYRVGGLGHGPDAVQARPWFLLAMRAGHAGATLALARAARNGDAEPCDPARAFALLQLASRRGSAQAMYLLSQSYAQGEGTATDPDLARHWLEQAAEQHLPAAMQDWALALEDGRLGVLRDAQSAREQWREAGEERRNRWNLR